MQPKLIITFEPLAEPVFLARAEGINSAMASNLSFPGPWPAPLSSPSSLTSLFTTYQNAYNAALTHDDAKIVLRTTARTALTVYLKKLAPYLEVIANGDVAKLLTTGYELRQSTTPTIGPDALPAPADFKVKRGPLSGQLVVHARKLPGAASYEVAINTGDPSVEASWIYEGTHKNANRILLEGLTPTQRVWVRMRGIGTNGPGAWTDPAGTVVL